MRVEIRECLWELALFPLQIPYPALPPQLVYFVILSFTFQIHLLATQL